jgi:hypothetical protein
VSKLTSCTLPLCFPKSRQSQCYATGFFLDLLYRSIAFILAVISPSPFHKDMCWAKAKPRRTLCTIRDTSNTVLCYANSQTVDVLSRDEPQRGFRAPPRTSCLKLSLIRSRYGGRSTNYDTSTYMKVVCRRFRRDYCLTCDSQYSCEHHQNRRIASLTIHSVHGYCMRCGPRSRLLLQRVPIPVPTLAQPTATHRPIDSLTMTRRDSDLEAFSHNPTVVASRHWSIDQAHEP